MTPLMPVSGQSAARGGAIGPLPEAAQPAATARSDQAVGQRAKQVVAQAREAGVVLPPNAQGLAASGIAEGTDVVSLFASFLLDQPDEEAPVKPDPVLANGGADDLPSASLPGPAELENLADDGAGLAPAPLNDGLAAALAAGDTGPVAAAAYADVAGAIAPDPLTSNDVALALLDQVIGAT